MVIHNEIFESYRIKMKQKIEDIEKAINVLTGYCYTVIGPDGEVLTKNTNEEKEELSSNNE